MDPAIRNQLQRSTQDARQLLEAEFAEQLEGTYDILPDGTIHDKPGTHLGDRQRLTRRKLIDAIEHRIAGGKASVEAVDDYTREAAFTFLNRFVALKMLEARELVQQCVSKGDQSSGFKEFTGLAPGLAELPDKGYCLYLECLFDELSIEVKVLFDRHDVASLLWPRRQALTDLLVILNQTELAGVWDQDETIGWIYQYFNAKEERDAMRKASRSPRNTREMAVRNQFFTPRYVVEFLTDNTLGRIWYEMHQGDTKLVEQCQYLVRRPTEIFLKEGEEPPEQESDENLSQEELLKQPVHIPFQAKKAPCDLKILDPACGSGHFLLYCFDLLLTIYEEAWHDEQSPDSETTGKAIHDDYPTIEALHEAAPGLILRHNLHGIDIDPRCAQIAAFALWMRAQRAFSEFGLDRASRPTIRKTNIVVAEPMPGEKDLLREFTATLQPPLLGQLVEVIFDKMHFAGEAGSLLKIEEELRGAIAQAREQWVRGPIVEQLKLFPGDSPEGRQLRFDLSGITDDLFWEQAESLAITALQRFAGRRANGVAFRRALFADDAGRGFAFIDLCRNRYDAILMNPPFGASSRASKGYIEARYPKTKGDVLANFVERTLDLAAKQGRVGAISSRTPFFLGSFEKLRTEVFGKMGHVRLLADLGDGVLEAMVETAIYVLTKHRHGEPESLFFRLLIDAEKGEILKQLTEECLGGNASGRTFVINPNHFEALNGSPYAYWVSRSTIETIGGHTRIEGNKGAIRVGLQTSNDWRFLRLAWEVPNRRICTGDSTVAKKQDQFVLDVRNRFRKADRQWAFFSKTEKASPWFSPLTLVIDWTLDGRLLEEFVRSLGYSPSRLIKSVEFYFRPGFSYMLRSTRLVPYLVPSGVMPTAGRAQIFPEQGEEYAVLGICASNVGSAVARFSGEMFARPKFQASMVQGLPACDFPEETLMLIKEHVDAEVNKRRAVVRRHEPFQEFTLPAWIQTAEEGETAWDLYSLFGRGLENKIAEAFGLNPEELAELERDIREAVSIRGHSEDIESEDAGEDSSEDEAELSIELISETSEEKAVGLLAYAVGVALGRWDVRIALDPSLAPQLPDPFDPLPVCPPGMLVGPDGMPAEPDCIASEEWLRARPCVNVLPPRGAVENPTVLDVIYPLGVSWDGILVDDLGHPVDVEARVHQVLQVIWKDRWEAIEREACDILGVRILRDYFRMPAGFFADHLKRYSKSRRKAPIYWQLATLSATYSVWLYYHRLTKDTLYKVHRDYVRDKCVHEQRTLDRLRAEAGPDPTRSQRDGIDKQEAFVAELKIFAEEIERIAPLWNPNLNDGVIINFAPLWRLVPQHKAWQRECKACWEKLVTGDYDWAHLAMHLWPERVVPKCRTDASLAIAHGLEDVFWQQDEKGKWVAMDKPEDSWDTVIEELVIERSSPAVKAALESLLSAPVPSNGKKMRKTGKRRKKARQPR